jgi:eukaryotic-like serine/threonine-protein kinase
MKIARYEGLDTLGRGGFGVVYLARDPELDRKVAIKVLHCDRLGGVHPLARARLQREAQALARFSHPNVVKVYDVGTHALSGGEETLFVVMELLEGTSLSQWLKERPRSCREVLEVFRRAGRGLAAAHARGLVHRDFKPANVMVTPEGDATVVDFGLARLATGSALAVEQAAMASDRTSSDGLGQTVTEPGSVPGTPAYMAPEQHAGTLGDARSDQYAFCVALYEALHGHRPFDDGDPRALRRAKEREAIAPRPSSRTDVPRLVHEAVMRGLRADPEARWPSMQQLLEQLNEKNRRPRRIALGIGGGLVAMAALLALVPGSTPCPQPTQMLEGLWDRDTQARAEEAFLAAEVPHAAATWERARARLDVHAERWVASTFEVCTSSQHRGTVPAPLVARGECLQRRRGQIEAMVRSFEQADREIVNRAVGAVSALPPVDPCTESDGLGSLSAPPPGPRADHVLAARQKLATVAVLQDLGKYEDAFEIAAEAVELARLGEYPPALAEAHLRMGRLALYAGRFELAADELAEASQLAMEQALDELAAVAETTLVDVVGDRLLRFDEGLRWGRHARAKLERLGRPPALHADLLTAIGNVTYRRGHHADALAIHEESLEIRSNVLGRDHPSTGLAYNNVGNALLELGRIEEAVAAYEEGLTILERVYGAEHPLVAWCTNNLGGAEIRRGNIETSRRHYERTLKIREATLSDDHPDLFGVLVNLGGFELQAGNLERARGLLQRALDLQEGGRADPLTFAGAMDNLALVLIELDEHEEAIRLLERGLLLRREHLGDHEITAITVFNLGHAEFRRGEFEKARERFVRAIEILENARSDGRVLVHVLAALGDSLVELGRFEDARDPLERALAMPDRLAVDVGVRARTQWSLAQALQATEKEHPRAVALAQAALEDAESLDDALLRQRIEQWLDTHGRMQ